MRPERGHLQTALVAYLFAVVMATTTLPTPLYPIYSERLSLPATTVTVVYAMYALGVLVTLHLLGHLSDHVGRRVVLFGAVGASALSGVVFMTTSGVGGLFLGRLVSGVSAGLVTGAATAYLAELETCPSRADALATVANLRGFGLGPLIAGLLAQYAGSPTVVPYVAGVLLLTPVLLAVPLRLPETVPARCGIRAGVRAGMASQRIGVPCEIRLAFAAAAIAGFAAFALLGFHTALVGQVLSDGLGNHSHQTAGLVAFLLFATAAVAQLAAGRLGSPRADLAGLALLPVGAGLVVAAVAAASLGLLVVAVAVAGAGIGLTFRTSLAAVTRMAPADRRAEVISAFFVAAYVGLSIPVVVAGVLVTTTSLLTAGVALAVLVGALAAAAGLIVGRLSGGAVESGPARSTPGVQRPSEQRTSR